MADKLFGTDGVRGVAGEFLTAGLALALGRAATRRTGVERPQVLVIRDTRESRVRKPLRFSSPRRLGSASSSARATPWRSAPACAEMPPPCRRATTSIRSW